MSRVLGHLHPGPVTPAPTGSPAPSPAPRLAVHGRLAEAQRTAVQVGAWLRHRPRDLAAGARRDSLGRLSTLGAWLGTHLGRGTWPRRLDDPDVPKPVISV